MVGLEAQNLSDTPIDFQESPLLPPANGLITLLTDFGLDDPYVGLMHGVIKRENRGAEVIDFCHGVPPQDVTVAGLFLQAAVTRFPVGTVHVAVVDPGVGTSRRCLGLVAYGCYWLAPDNGVLTAFFDHADELRELRPEVMDLRVPSATFHGRDVFGPVAGKLSGGRYGFRSLGPRVTDPERQPDLSADAHRVVHIDGFGNLITTIRAQDLVASGAAAIQVGGLAIPIQATYASVAAGEPLAVVNSYDLVEIAVCQGNASEVLGIGAGAPVAIVPRR